MRNSWGMISLAALACLLCVPSASFAHKVKMFAAAEGDLITGYVYFTTGGKPKNATIRVQNAAGHALSEVTTDANGAFTFTAQVKQDYVFVLELADGHRASFTVSADELPDALPPAEGVAQEAKPPSVLSSGQAGPPSPSSSDLPAPGLAVSLEEVEKIVDKAVSKQVRPLREQLEQYEEKIRFHDILGGIGYIVGLMGIASFFGARRQQQREGK